MSAKPARPSDDDRVDARRRFLAAVRRGEHADQLVLEAYQQHPRNDTFPGEVYLTIGADALILAGYRQDDPLPQDGLAATWLPEVQYRGRNNAKLRFAILACAARAGGLDVDLLDEVVWWGTDNYYEYAACAALALIRAAADRLDVDVAEFARRLADETGVAAPPDDGPTTC